VKIVSAAANFHGFGVAHARPWNTWMNKPPAMRQMPPGGIMAVVANPLEKNQVGKEEEVSCRSLLFLGGVGG
jgi:hypothetical protein